MEGQRESSLPGRAESVSMKSSWGCRGSRNAPSDWRVSGANTLTSDQSTIRLHGVNGLDAWVTPLAGGIQQGRAAGPFGKRVVLQRTACASSFSSHLAHRASAHIWRIELQLTSGSSPNLPNLTGQLTGQAPPSTHAGCSIKILKRPSPNAHPGRVAPLYILGNRWASPLKSRRSKHEPCPSPS